MRGMVRAGAEVHEERALGRDLLGVRNHADGVIHQVGGQVIPFLARRPVFWDGLAGCSTNC